MGQIKILTIAALAMLLLGTFALRPQPAWTMPQSSFVYPLMSPKLSSGFGQRIHPLKRARRHHNGVDLAAPDGAPIRAIRAGTVVFADPYGGYGKLVVVKHSDGYTSHYGHCESIQVRPGQRVRAGQVIATVGSTGRVTGPHLHFELRRDGKPLDPERYFPNLAAPAQG